MQAILIFIELVIRSGILLMKILGAALGMVMLVSAFVYPAMFIVDVVVLIIGYFVWQWWERKKKKSA